MLLISHRRNTLEDLITTPNEFGIEVDIRSQGNDLVIHHDPFTAGLNFEKWMDHYDHAFLILNVKEEGLEDRLLTSMAVRDVEEFFFLDQSFPFIVKTAKTGERRCAARFSEYEALESVLGLADQIDWVWVDCFTKLPLNSENVGLLKDSGLKLCLVSPELQGRLAEAEVADMRALLQDIGCTPNAVCTKRPDLWQD